MNDPRNLTDAELDAIEARLNDEFKHALYTTDHMAYIASLLVAVGEARALVERLWEPECPTHNTAYGYACDYCGEVPDDHSTDCAWDAARKALAKWKGGGNVPG